MEPTTTIDTKAAAGQPTLRDTLVGVARHWQERYGVAPAITSTISELDAALLVGMTDDEYALDCASRTAVTKGHDFTHDGIRYQVKANRPSGKKGSPVTLVAKATNLEWDRLIWLLYNTDYTLAEAWMWEVEDYEREITPLTYSRPNHLRAGHDLLATPSGTTRSAL